MSVCVVHSWTERIRIFGVGIEHFHDNDGSNAEALYEVQIKTREWERLGRPPVLEVRLPPSDFHRSPAAVTAEAMTSHKE